MKKITLLLILISFINCTRIKDYGEINISENLIVCELNQNEKNNSIDTLIKDITYIPLETHNESTIGEVNEILYVNDKFYIYDNAITKSVFVFNKNGEFLFKINNLGRGPGEYTTLNGFDIDVFGNLFLGDNSTKRILKYDSLGNFITEHRIDYYFEEFCVINEDELLLRNAYNNSDDIVAALGILNLKNNEFTKIFPPRDVFDDFDVSRFSPNYLFKSEGSIYYNRRFDNNIYRITENQLTKALTFDEKFCPTQDYVNQIKKDISLVFTDNRYITDIRNIYENSQYITLLYHKQNSTNILLSKNTKKEIAFTSIYDDRYFGDNYFMGVTENELISLVHPTMPDNKWIEKVDNSCLNEEIKKELILLNPSSNPIVSLIEIKEF